VAARVRQLVARVGAMLAVAAVLGLAAALAGLAALRWIRRRGSRGLAWQMRPEVAR
jgi:hypothetical protein